MLEELDPDLMMELDSLNISNEDALFFSELVKNPQFSLDTAQNRLINLGELTSTNEIQAYKSMSVSKGLVK